MKHITICTLIDIANFLSNGPIETEAGSFYHGGIPGSWYNRIQICGNYYDANGIEKTMEAVKRMIPEGTSPLFSLYRAERDDALVTWMEKHGAVLINPQTTMQYDLSLLSRPEDSSAVLIPKSRLREWADCCAASFLKKDEYTCFESLASHCSFYGFLQNGIITSTLMLNRVGTCAGLHEIATRPEFRNRGQASKLVHQALWDARQAGCTYGVLQASARGYSLYKHFGFTDQGFLYNFRWNE